MKFCQAHWDYLRKAIDERGLSHLVAQSGEQAASNTLAELEGRVDEVNWDPLMAAHWNLVSFVLDRVGLYLFQGEQCPMCLVQEDYDKLAAKGPLPEEARDAHWWMDDCCDAMLRHARERGLVPDVQ